MLTDWAAQIRAGDRRAIARAITAVENDTAQGQALITQLAGATGRAAVIGITGPPGAGKSTLVNALIKDLIGRGHSVGVIAVDPSSPLTGGAVLGDRVRMGDVQAQQRVFIRSLAARGHLGGLTRNTTEVVDVLDAAGFDYVLIETVGTGQSEVEITGIAGTRLVVCPPGLGDDVQALKAGVFEIADIFVVNKADLPDAERTEHELRAMLAMRRAECRRPVLKTVATTGEGVAALADAMLLHAAGSDRADPTLSFPRMREPSAFQRTPLGPRRSLPSSALVGGGDDNVLVSQGAPSLAMRGAMVPGLAASGATSLATTASHAMGQPDITPVDTGPRALLERLAGRDRHAMHLGLEFVDGGAGHASVRMRIRPDHINFFGTCHGGAIFSLADTALGLACNSYGTLAVLIDSHMTFSVAVHEGDVLLARAVEINRTRKLAIYRMDVTNEDGELVASLTGTVYLTAKPLPECIS